MRRPAVTTSAGAAGVVGVAVFASARWLNLRWPPGLRAAPLAVAIVAGVVALWLLVRCRWQRILVGGLGSVLLLGVAGITWLAGIGAYHVTGVVARTPGPDGAVALVTQTGFGALQIDPSHRVVLERRRGALSQQVLVWEGPEEGDGPRVVRFTGPRDIEVVSADRCIYRSAFDTITLQPERVYRQHALDRCG
jgi:hypothetical protein